MGRLEAVALFLIGGAAVAVSGQSSSDARIQSQLKQLFPSATAFSPKETQPPHFKSVPDRLIRNSGARRCLWRCYSIDAGFNRYAFVAGSCSPSIMCTSLHTVSLRAD